MQTLFVSNFVIKYHIKGWCVIGFTTWIEIKCLKKQHEGWLYEDVVCCYEQVLKHPIDQLLYSHLPSSWGTFGGVTVSKLD